MKPVFGDLGQSARDYYIATNPGVVEKALNEPQFVWPPDMKAICTDEREWAAAVERAR